MIPADAAPSTMRAVQLLGYGGLDQLVYRDDVPTPRPAPGDVLVRVGACGVNNTDVNLRTRWYDRAVAEPLTEEFGVRGASLLADAEAQGSWNEESVGFPRIQGAAIAGRVVAAGDTADQHLVGVRVLVDPQLRDTTRPAPAQLTEYVGGDRDGGFAEYVVVPAANACPVDSPLSDAALATFPTSYDTAEEMLARTRLADGETVLITGAAGGVGTALVQLSLVRGAQVVAVASGSKLDRLRELGAHHVVDRESPDLVAAVEELVGPQGIDVAADVVGGRLYSPVLRLLRRGGRYATAGAIGGPLVAFDIRDLIYKDLEMHGITCTSPESFRRVVELVSAGKLRPLLERTFDLSEVADAQAELVRRSHVGKFAITP